MNVDQFVMKIGRFRKIQSNSKQNQWKINGRKEILDLENK